METIDDQIIEESSEQIPTRKELLPKWILVFSWIFLVLGLIVPVGLVFGILGFNFTVSLYGFETNNILTTTGILLSVLILLKGITGFGLIKKQDWAIKAALIDGAIGILITGYVLFQTISGPGGLRYQIDLLFLIPYFIKMLKIQRSWESTKAYN